MGKSETCAKCGEEVRWGERGGRLAWWHRDDWPDTTIVRHRRVNGDGSEGHEPVFGKPSWTSTMLPPASEPRDENGEEDTRIFDIPPPEVRATPIEVGDPMMPGGAKNLINATRKAGGEARATYSRGPRVHASNGNLLGMSDYVVVVFDNEDRHAMATWEDGKLDWAWRLDYDRELMKVSITTITSKSLRAWICRGEEA
jgi:hypothetical protein